MKAKIIPFLLVVLAIISGILFLILGNNVSVLIRIILKIIPTLMMCIWMVIKTVDKTNWPILIGLLLSMTCDIFMALTGNMYLVGGIASNMLALLFYTLYFYRSDARLELFRLIPIFVIMGIFYFVLYDYLGNYKIPVMVYCFIYIVFLWRATARLGDKEISKYSQQVCFLGSILITVSDCLLSFLLFNVIPERSKFHYMVMLLWWSGLLMLMITAEIKRKSNKKQSIVRMSY
jgi:uncharacterized membrane protein YhhN